MRRHGCADVDPDEDEPSALARDLERLGHRRRRTRGLDHDVEAPAARDLGDRVVERVVRERIERLHRAQLERPGAARLLRLEQNDPRVVRGRSHHTEEADGAAADHRHGIRGIDAVCGDRRVYATENGSTIAPCLNESSSGSLCSHSPRAFISSASAPSIEKPKWSRPPGPTTHSPTTVSPGLSPRTAAPTSSTSPHHSCPGMIGYETGMMYRPSKSSKSEWQMPTARGWMRTSSGPICGSATSLIGRLVRGFEDERFHSSSKSRVDGVEAVDMRTFMSLATPEASCSKAVSTLVDRRSPGDDALDGQPARGDLRGDAGPVVDAVAPGADDRQVVERQQHQLDLGGRDVQADLHDRAAAPNGANARIDSPAVSGALDRDVDAEAVRPLEELPWNVDRARVEDLAEPNCSTSSRRAGFGSEL